jgi:hypothetical protein
MAAALRATAKAGGSTTDQRLDQRHLAALPAD